MIAKNNVFNIRAAGAKWVGQAMAMMETGTCLSYDVIASVANKFNIRIIG